MTKAISYYVYEHHRNDTGEVFYVGKGTRTKKHQHSRSIETKGRSKYWLNIVNKHGFVAEIIAEFFNEKDAYEFERERIASYGRKVDGGELCNLSTGGDGAFGCLRTEEQKLQQSIRVSGANHPNWGKKLSEETCKKKSESMKNSELNLRGKKLPQWWKDRIAVTKVGDLNPMHKSNGRLAAASRPVIHTRAGVFYENVTEAGEAFGINMKTLYNMLSGQRRNSTPLEFA